MDILTLSTKTIDSVSRLQRGGARRLYCKIGENRWDSNREILIRSVQEHEIINARFVQFDLLENSSLFHPHEFLPQCAGILSFTNSGNWQAIALENNVVRSIDRLKLIGPGMHLISPNSKVKGSFGPGNATESVFAESHSRTDGALGKNVLERLRSLNYCLIGAGRTGSALAASFVEGWGIRRLTMIDPDHVELHNIGESSGLHRSDVGISKVQSLSNALVFGNDSPVNISTVPKSVIHADALRAIGPCDVVFCCVDSDAARIAASLLSTLYCKPMIDVGSGIMNSGEHRTMGADVRFVLPGEACLLCMGGVADLPGARKLLLNPAQEEKYQADRIWFEERAGSLRSLNQLAVSLAVRCWEDFVAERVNESAWIHADFDANGRIRISYRSTPRNDKCPICRLYGGGDAEIRNIPSLIRDLNDFVS